MTATSADICVYGHNRWAFQPGVTVVASSAHASFPDDNLLVDRLDTHWRGAVGTLSNVTITVDLGATRTARAFALAGLNLSSGALGRVEVATNSGFSPKTYDSDPSGPAACWDVSRGYTAMPAQGRIFQRIASDAVSARYVRFTLTDTGNAENQLAAAYPVIDEIYQPGAATGHSGMDPGAYEASRELSGPLGSGFSVLAQKMVWSNQTAGEAAELHQILDTILGHRRVVVVPRPTDPASWLQEVRVVAVVWPVSTGTVPNAWWLRQTEMTFRMVTV